MIYALQIVLILLRAFDVIDWNWTLVLIPSWIMLIWWGFVVFLMLAYGILSYLVNK